MVFSCPKSGAFFVTSVVIFFMRSFRCKGYILTCDLPWLNADIDFFCLCLKSETLSILLYFSVLKSSLISSICLAPRWFVKLLFWYEICKC